MILAAASAATPDQPVPLAAYVLEYGLCFAGLCLLAWGLWHGARRRRNAGLPGLRLSALALGRRLWRRRIAPRWPGSMGEGILLVAAAISLWLITGALLPLVSRLTGLSGGHFLMVAIVGTDAALFIAIAGFHFGYRPLTLRAPRPPKQSRWRPLGQGAIVFLATLAPVLLVASGWQMFLEWCGHPATPQEVVDLFLQFNSVPARAVFVLFAAVLAPIAEEILFRGVLYRACLKQMPRSYAVVVSAVAFGAAHLDITAFLPLTVLGAFFALAYDATGDITVTMTAHALFNINTMVALLLGLQS